jgi:2-dehydro-3-deoxyphosphogluconate aldolase / (4S)-4-hydroxy-2-oxoglutarate aldolase
MARDRLSMLAAIEAQGVIPIFHHADLEVCTRVIAACSKAGAKCVEFTNRGDYAAHTFLDLSRHFAKADPSLVLGAGSIVDASTAALFIANGARFIVGPMTNAEVARLCNRRLIAYLPGCATTTEIGNAQELGCEIVKLFPGDGVGGPATVKAILGPMPWTKLMPTGGVEPTEESLRAWFGAGIAAAGMGSKLITPTLLDAKDYDGIERRVRDTLALAKKVRGKS